MLLPKASSNVYNFTGETYRPRTAAKPIPILETDKPSRPFVRIARIETWAILGKNEDAFEEMRSRAMELGADAVIAFTWTNETHQTNTTTIRESEKVQFGWDGAEREREKTIDNPQRYTRTVFSGIAIRYEEAP